MKGVALVPRVNPFKNPFENLVAGVVAKTISRLARKPGGCAPVSGDLEQARSEVLKPPKLTSGMPQLV